MDLQVRAQAWANQMAATGMLDHDMNGIKQFKDGENIGFSINAKHKPLCQGSPNPNCYHCSETVRSWYKESRNYNFQKGNSANGKTYLHFTQLEWRKTTHMGVGVGMRKNYVPNNMGQLLPVYEIYTVVKYSPRGNYGYTKDYLENVKPASSGSPGTKPSGNTPSTSTSGAKPAGVTGSPEPKPAGVTASPGPNPAGATGSPGPNPAGATGSPGPNPAGATGSPGPKPAGATASPGPKPAGVTASPAPNPAGATGSPGPKPAGATGSPGPKPAGATGSPGPKPAGVTASPGPKPAGVTASPGPKPAGATASPGPKPAGVTASPGPKPAGVTASPAPNPAGVTASPGPNPAGATGSPGPKPAGATGSPGPKPAGAVASPATKPAGVTASPGPKPAGATASPATKPAGATASPATKPAGAIASPATKPAGTTASPATKPAGVTASPATKPAGAIASPATKPAGATASPATKPAGTTASPATKPAGAIASPATKPAGATASPATKPAGVTASPASPTPNTPAVQPTTQGPNTPAVKPTTQSPSTPAVKPATQSPSTPAVKPTTQGPATPGVKPATQSPATPAVKPTTQGPATPGVKPTTQSPATPAVKPATQGPATPAVKPTTQGPATPAVKPATQSPATPAVKPTTQGPATPGVKPATQGPAIPGVKPATQGPATPAVKPATQGPSTTAVKPTTQGPATPGVKPATQGPATPAVKPATQGPSTPAVKPATQGPSTTAVKPATQSPSTPAVKPTTQGPATPAVKPATQGPATPGVKPATQGPATPGVKPATQGPATPGVKPTTQGPATTAVKPATQGPATPGVKPATQGPATPGVKPATQSPATPGVKPATQSPATPGVKPATQGPATPGVKPATQGPATPGVKPATQGPATPAVKPATQGPATPGVKPATQGPATPAVKPATQGPATPAVKPATQGPATPGVKPATQGPVTPKVKPATQSPATPAVKPATLGPATPGVKPATQGPATSAVKPTTQGPATPAVKPATQGPSTPAVKPATQSPAIPAVKPATQGPATPAAKPTTQSPSTTAVKPATQSPSTPAVNPTTPAAPAQGTPAAQASNQPYDFNKDCVTSHNKLRAVHGSPALAWSKELEVHAQEWANHLANRDIFKHDIAGLTKYQEGENIAWFMGKDKKCAGKVTSDCYTCGSAVQSWYNEVKDYDYQKADAKTPGKQVLHFTQVVWKATTQMAIATAVSPTRKVIFVARYKPRGNFGNKQAYIDNVTPPGTPLPKPPPTSSKPYNFNQDCVDTHNKLRASHGSPQLVWSQALADHAQVWVNDLAKRDAFEHDIAGLNKYQEGENIAWFMGKGKVCTTELTNDCYPCSKAIFPWYNEVKDYDFAKGGPKTSGAPVLHFTQVVWRATKELGVATAISPSKKIMFVARYKSRGNFGHKQAYIDNVKPKGTPVSTGGGTTPAPSATPTTATGTPAVTPKTPPTTPAAGASLPKPPPTSSKPYNFNQDCVDTHNKLRASHGSPQLVWSQALADHAQVWVNDLAKRDAFEHDIAGLNKFQEGENIAWFMGKGKVCTTELTNDCYPCSKAIFPWYNEVKDYDFAKGGPKTSGAPVLHFTQVVWKATKELGVAAAISPSKKVMFVARYKSRGNFGNQQAYIDNVKPKGTTPAPSTATATKPTSAAAGTSVVASKPATATGASVSTPAASTPAASTSPAATSVAPGTPAVSPKPPATTPAVAPKIPATSPPATRAGTQQTGTIASDAPSTTDLDYFLNDCLQKHNLLRAKHGAAPLTWSTKLAADATNWAEYLASSNKMEHDYKKLGEKGEGENLAWLTPVQPKCSQYGQTNCYTCSQIIDTWYKEIKNYDFNAGKSTQGSIEHFVQIVWKGTREIGAGTAIGDKYGLIMVTRYKSRGGESKNPQEFIDNVKPIGSPTSPIVMDCKDDPKKFANCTEWKQQGFCENFKESMRMLCPLTCGMCIKKSPDNPKLNDLSSTDGTDAFEQDCLDAHNIYRTKHGVPPLLWSQQLKEDAQRWANRLAEMGDELQHDDMKPLNEGENLAHFSPPSEKCYGAKGPGCVQCREIVKDWYDEEADYDFTQGHRKPGAVVLHFTQVVWKSTRHVGVATAKNKNWFITVARYSPRGNVIGQFRDNVHAIGGTATIDPVKIVDDSEQRQFKIPPRKMYATPSEPKYDERVYPEDAVYSPRLPNKNNKGQEVKYFATNSPYGNGELTAIVDDKPPPNYAATYSNEQELGRDPYIASYSNDNSFSNNHLMRDMNVENDLAANVEQNEGMLLMDGKRKKSIVKNTKA
ncbi:uncharacterized protein LOC114538021 isoform X2 [Dendronephthya gigantea]|uniref:uncharacterized protein LOC114538021 isoform X2 n=1 Tax=Dendronephthya gigantea TaxID=151771 RepID=UPI00106D1D0D|nr:uncharacterized protein LOC114538021 isoform X2 [Dendronephthya gigantea]